MSKKEIIVKMPLAEKIQKRAIKEMKALKAAGQQDSKEYRKYAKVYHKAELLINEWAGMIALGLTA